MVKTELKTPDEILKEIEKLKMQYEKAEVDLKEAKLVSIQEAVRKAAIEDVGFEEKFKLFLSKRKSVASKVAQIDKLRSEANADIVYLKDQYSFIQKTLIGTGAKEDWLSDVIGKPPSAPAAKTPGASVAGTKAPRTYVCYPDGTNHTWIEFARTQGFSDAELVGTSAKREFFNKYKVLPVGYTEVAK